MNREQARDSIKQQILCTDFLEQSKSYSAAGQTGYCCPYCGSGHGHNGTGAVKYYPESNTWYCHACDKGGDVIDAYKEYAGCDYNEALTFLAAEIGTTIDGRQPAALDFDDDAENTPRSVENRQKDKYPGAQNKNAQSADFTAYYKACADRLTDPAAVSYLQARGISIDTARRFNVGFDPAADPANAPGALADEYRPHPAPRIIIPCSASHYVAHSIDPNTPAAYKKLNPDRKKGGGEVSIFNAGALYDGADVVFICEGWADALSFLEAGKAAIALNSKSNGKRLPQQLQERPTAAALVIVPDNDDDPKTAADTMKRAQDLYDGLQAMNQQSIIYNVAGTYHDANDALQHDRAAFEAAIAAALEELKKQNQPAGLLTYEKAVAVFETANDKFIEMQNFKEFSKRAKIKLHDSVVLAADTGAGKSSLAINFIDNLNDDYPVMYFNLEMDELTVLRRLVSIRTGIELEHIAEYRTDSRTAAAVNTALKIITDRKPLQILQDTYSLKDMEKEIRRATAGREDPTIVVIDHGLLATTEESFSRYERFTRISEELRRISRLNNVIMFVLLQQNRSGKENEKRPANSSLKESGSWENDATHILFLWYDPDNRKKKLLMTKNRSGALGTFNLDYFSGTQFYKESDYQPDDSSRSPAGKENKREKENRQLQEWYDTAYIDTFGNVTLKAIAEAGGTTTGVVKRRLKEYGGFTVDGIQYDAAGVDTVVEESAFIRMTPGEAPPFDDEIPTI